MEHYCKILVIFTIIIFPGPNIKSYELNNIHSSLPQYYNQKPVINDIQRIAVLGDSITQDGGYIEELKRTCPNYIFHNYGLSGETTSQILRRIRIKNGNLKHKILALENYDQIIVLAGINNIDDPHKVIADLKTIYKKAKTLTPQPLRVIAVTLSPWGGYKTWSFKKQQYTEQVNDFILSHPENVDVVVNIYDALKDNHSFRMKQGFYRPGDRLHPRGEGQLIIGQTIYKTAFTISTNH